VSDVEVEVESDAGEASEVFEAELVEEGAE
jgi:hypothetical protein